MDTKQHSREEGKTRRPAQEARPAPRRPEQSGKRPAPESREERPSRPQNTPQRPARPAPTQEGSRPQRPAARPSGAQRQQPEQAAPRAQQTGRKQPGNAAKKRPPEKKAGALRPARRQGHPADGIGGKRRAYGNSKPKKQPGAVKVAKSVGGFLGNKAKERKEKKGKRKRSQIPTPAVIYTQPLAFNRDRLLIQLITVTAVVAAMVIGLSLFFKVETITVSGADVYTAWTIREASGINEGDNLLTFSRARAGAKIKGNLPYVRDVRFGIKLPDTVNIIVVEEDVVYAIQDQNGQWWLMNSQGRVVEQTTGGKASNYTQILGVYLESPAQGLQAAAVESVPTATDENGDLIPVAVTGAQRLSAVLEILKALEDNDIVGSAASVDVSQMEQITLWYGSRYQVNLGDTSQISYKIACMNDVILQLSDYQSGNLDISFKIWPDKVGYTPFS